MYIRLKPINDCLLIDINLPLCSRLSVEIYVFPFYEWCCKDRSCLSIQNESSQSKMDIIRLFFIWYSSIYIVNLIPQLFVDYRFMATWKKLSGPLNYSIVKWICENLCDIGMHDRSSLFCLESIFFIYFIRDIRHWPSFRSEFEYVSNCSCFIIRNSFSSFNTIPTWRLCHNSSFLNLCEHPSDSVFLEVDRVLRCHSEVHSKHENIVSCSEKTIRRYYLFYYSLLKIPLDIGLVYRISREAIHFPCDYPLGLSFLQ